MSPNVYDQAHLLASSLKESPEYADYRLALTRLQAEPNTIRIFRDFRKRQFQLQSRLLQGEEIPASERERFAQLSEIIGQHEPISAFLGAEFRLSRLLGDIQKIISDAVELTLGFEGQDEAEGIEPGAGPEKDITGAGDTAGSPKAGDAGQEREAPVPDEERRARPE